MSDEQKTASEWLAEIDAVGCRVNTVGGQRLMKMIKRIQNETLDRAAEACRYKSKVFERALPGNLGFASGANECRNAVLALKESTDTPQEKK